MPKKRTTNRYWTKITECAIQAYNNSDDTILREKIYRRFLFYPLLKLAENRINQMKPDYIDKSFEDLQTDLVTYLTERLYKIKTGKGRGFSYFTRTSWNYLIQENQRGYSKIKTSTEPIDVDDERNLQAEMSNDDMANYIVLFMDAFVEYCYENLNTIFSTPIDIHVADSVLFMFQDRENIQEFNKKTLYILIRERTGIETTYITRVIKTLKQIYVTKFKEYQNTDFTIIPF